MNVFRLFSLVFLEIKRVRLPSRLKNTRERIAIPHLKLKKKLFAQLLQFH